MADNPHPVDIHVGNRLRVRRALVNLTQDALADKLGITFQQIQKYEKGVNRISASKLYMIAKILGVDVGYFFAGYDGEDEAPQSKSDVLYEFDNGDLLAVKGLASLPDNVRSRVRDLLKTLFDEYAPVIEGDKK